MKVQFYYNNGDVEFDTDFFEFPVAPDSNHFIDILGFLREGTFLEELGIKGILFKPNKYTWINNEDSGLYLEIELVQ